MNVARIPSARAPLRAALLAFAALAAACAASSEQLVPLPPQDVELTHPELCRIYVFRSSQVMGSGRTMRVFERDKEIGTLSGDEFLCWERPAGRTLLRIVYEGPGLDGGRREDLYDLDAAPGTTHYLGVSLLRRSEQKAGGDVISSPKLEPMSAEEGRERVKNSTPAGSG